MASPPSPKVVGVVVMGDVGRSPRMQYHARSIASLKGAPPVSAGANGSDTTSITSSSRNFSTTHYTSGHFTSKNKWGSNTALQAGYYETWLVGHTGSPCIDDIEQSSNIFQHRISPVQAPMMPGVLYILSRLAKAVLQFLQLLWVLLVKTPRFDTILVQNPPSIPLLFVAALVKYLRGSRLVVDWHNLGFTMIAKSMHIDNVYTSWNPVISAAYFYEKFCAQVADHHLTVSEAMKNWVSKNFGVAEERMTVFHDQAPRFLKPTPLSERHHLFQKLGFCLSENGADTLFTSESYEEAPEGETELKISVRPDRPALLVSSTSWTSDEDFSILFDALVDLDKTVCNSPQKFPSFVVIVTGKGPEKEFYRRKIDEMSLRFVRIYLKWLEASDYPKLLGAADLGISLHTSTSGKDLPMKVVDMFGCNLPVRVISLGCV
eukprot:gb/GECG01007983.1/.p1 GENE.gb/GECG01007983.1/~~gb/GECG01007983.1/.p1  ORF type:complete len:433 (+),score=31.25 gb/GECG01007983.1/:1-1299(+)